MPTAEQLEEKFWNALKSDRTVMLGLDGVDDGHARPMTAQTEDSGHGPLWFFTATDNGLVRALGSGPPQRAVCTFASKGHELFAAVHGALRVDTDRAVIERLWNPFVAAWYTGKDDPKIALLRLDTEQGEIWENENSLLAGIKMLFGKDPKDDYRDKVARVDLD
jgi:general stress protein 26